MIPIESLQKAVERPTAKAAIEIPDDYLAGLRKCTNTEKGDLSMEHRPRGPGVANGAFDLRHRYAECRTTERSDHRGDSASSQIR